MEVILAWLATNGVSYGISFIGALLGASVVGWLLSKIPMEAFQKKFGGFMRGLGIACTLGLSKWKYTKGLWNKTLEPFFIHVIRDILIFGIDEFIKGLESDNK